MTPKVKTILIVCGIVSFFPISVALLIWLHDFLYLFITVITISSCLVITAYGLYEVVYEEMTRRSRIHEELYHGKSAEVRRWLDFFLKYFGESELK